MLIRDDGKGLRPELAHLDGKATGQETHQKLNIENILDGGRILG